MAEDYDAGVQLGEVIGRDMIAVPVSGDVRLTVVGAPSYFARYPELAQPRDLVAHECIAWHPVPGTPAYRWGFTDARRDFSVATPIGVLTTDGALLVRLARAGVGPVAVSAAVTRPLALLPISTPRERTRAPMRMHRGPRNLGLRRLPSERATGLEPATSSLGS